MVCSTVYTPNSQLYMKKGAISKFKKARLPSTSNTNWAVGLADRRFHLLCVLPTSPRPSAASVV